MALRTLDPDLIHRAPFHPRLFGTNGAVTSEHYLSANAGADVLKAGGNAVDAVVCAALVEGVVNPHQHTLGGECPILIQMADAPMPVVINGNTMAPAAATVENYRARGLSEVPDAGILAAGVPAALGAYTKALGEFGSMTFSEVAAAALNLCRNGFPAHRGLIHMTDFGVNALQHIFRDEWHNNAEIYLPENLVPEAGQLLQNPALADCLQTLCDVERSTAGNRKKGISQVRKEFYSGDIAGHIVNHSKARDGLIERRDLERYITHTEKPVHVDFENTRIFKCGAWNQGPAMLQALSILKNFDLRALGHNSSEYLHIVIEAVKLAFADREQWYGDPAVVEVPIDELLSKEYGKLRSELIDEFAVDAEIRPGDPTVLQASLPIEQRLGGASWGHGTVHVDAIDSVGNMVSATPSGGWIRSSEVVRELGFPLGNRLMTFYLEPQHHPNIIAPYKRPRTTISPTLVHRDGIPWMVYGSMGGDQQDQWMLQFLLNRVVFNLTLAESIDAPKFSSEHFPGFFAPHEAFKKRVRMEPRVGESVIEDLRNKGHDIELVPDWTEGFLLAIEKNAKTGVLEAACDPRGAKGDVFPAAAVCW